LFSRGQGTIDPQVVTTLDKLAAVLTANADVRITLIAYADSDNAAPPREARHLSLNRALAIRDYLAG
jgi:outer membrane protein OmpA-like peptidoglycan-associated protein